jgi:hypothetical protein
MGQGKAVNKGKLKYQPGGVGLQKVAAIPEVYPIGQAVHFPKAPPAL